MSTTVTKTVDHCRPSDATPVTVPADALESTAPDHLRDVKYELSRDGFVPAELTLTVAFDADCSLATQREAETVRDHVRAAAFLGAGRVTATVEAVANPEKVVPALEAARERARREGVSLTFEGLAINE